MINQNLSSLSVSYDESGPGYLCGLLDELWGHRDYLPDFGGD